jgi:hypothetical protein
VLPIWQSSGSAIGLSLTGVPVEKLFSAKFAKIKSRQDALPLQAIFSDRETFCIPQILAICVQMGLFQQTQAFAQLSE